MIEFKDLVSTIQEQLNAIPQTNQTSFYWEDTQPFRLFADIGDFEHYIRAIDSNKITKCINCIAEVLTPDLMAYKGLQISTQTVNLQFVLDVDMLSKDTNGDFVEVVYVKELLNKFITANNGTPFTMSDSSTSFEVTPSYSGVTTGIVEQMSPFGRTLILTIVASFTMVESGVNSNNVSWELDGEEIFVQSATVTRTRTAETSTNANQKVTNTVIQSNGINFNFKSPLLNNNIMKAVENDILVGGNNIPHLLVYKRDTITKPYCVVFGEDTLSTGLAQNIGLSYNLAEARMYIAVQNSSNWISRNQDLLNTKLNIDISNKGTLAVWWGDGTTTYIKKDKTTQETISHTYSSSGEYQIYICAIGVTVGVLYEPTPVL